MGWFGKSKDELREAAVEATAAKNRLGAFEMSYEAADRAAAVAEATAAGVSPEEIAMEAASRVDRERRRR